MYKYCKAVCHKYSTGTCAWVLGLEPHSAGLYALASGEPRRWVVNWLMSLALSTLGLSRDGTQLSRPP
ncbi:hypothetical protein ACRRTK_004719 [Alexandromys fortis]